RCAPWERFLAHTADPFPPTLPTAATIAIRTPPLPPSPGETLRPRGFSHRRRDAKSLIYLSIRTPPLPPSPGETLRPRGFSHRRRDAKSLIYLGEYATYLQTAQLLLQYAVMAKNASHESQ